MRPFTTLRPAYLLLVATAVFGCGGGGAAGPSSTIIPPPPPGTPNSVVITGSSFTPTDLTVTSGSTVKWTWNSCTGGDGYGAGQTCITHNVVFDDGSAASGALDQGTYSRAFSTPGTYPYHCAIHGPSMAGRILVQ